MLISEKSGAETLYSAQHQIDTINLMFREANHRIANSLQTTMALARAASHDGKVDPNNGRDTLGRLAAIANIHRLLSLTGASGMLAIEGYLGTLVSELRAIWSGHQAVRALTLSCPAREVSVDVAIRLGMIVNELATNSCKYAYPNGGSGEVRTVFCVQDASYVLLVADDGIGWKPGTAVKGDGMGQSIVRRLAAQIGGAFRYVPAAVGTIALLTGPAEVLLAKDAITWERPGGGPGAAPHLA